MVTPARIQLSRAKGFRLQEHSLALNGLPAVKVDRSTKWGNPYTKAKARELGNCECHWCLAATYKGMLTDHAIDLIRKELAGKNLACWCPPELDCHAEVLLEIANDLPEFSGRDVTPAALRGQMGAR
jgi:hypothetical protein